MPNAQQGRPCRLRLHPNAAIGALYLITFVGCAVQVLDGAEIGVERRRPVRAVTAQQMIDSKCARD